MKNTEISVFYKDFGRSDYVQNMGNDCEKMAGDTFLIFGGRISYIFG